MVEEVLSSNQKRQDEVEGQVELPPHYHPTIHIAYHYLKGKNPRIDHQVCSQHPAGIDTSTYQQYRQ